MQILPKKVIGTGVVAVGALNAFMLYQMLESYQKERAFLNAELQKLQGTVADAQSKIELVDVSVRNYGLAVLSCMLQQNACDHQAEKALQEEQSPEEVKAVIEEEPVQHDTLIEELA